MDIAGYRTLNTVWAHWVDRQPDKPFLLYEDPSQELETFTYGEMESRIARMAGLFRELGVSRGTIVNLHMNNSPIFYMAWLGAARLGAALLCTNPLSSVDELRYLLNHSGAVLSITDRHSAEAIGEAAEACPDLHHILVAAEPGEPLPSQRMLPLSASLAGAPDARIHETGDSEMMAGILYTSGTTSKPKGVIITHANYIYAGETMARGVRLGPDDRQLAVLPLFHGNAQYYSTMSALVVGASIGLTARFSASRYFKQAIRLRATVGSLFAAPIRMILRQPYDPEDRNHSLRAVWFAQSVTREELRLFSERYGDILLQLYGMTETMGTPLMNPLDGDRRNETIGLPTLGYEVRVVDDAGRDCPVGIPGQIIVRGTPGRSIMKGYYKNEEATRETIRDGWLYTGDVAKIDAEGYFHFVDRIKDMVKRAGENVAAGEVEAVLLQHPDVADAAVIGVPDPIRDEKIVAYLIPRSPEHAPAEDLIEYCRQRLARFKVPEEILFVEELPRTSVGKIQKHILRQWYKEGP
ncbi:class I adenylate-forming enzyme family protein [Kyrpidia tusciae]|uniref:AMP-dependent synthetase and ligase n=1 Tax=Kyrpidia tusciae (strain DSM 2912 / NBRC 15312 / T2) TaxID=562970 RepID=D5WSY3_KYRT2|nr:AMP-binding protein [Kyrpidia tusciae]ADG05087.1 AMP-dependent synthetase and ligase [Kyrpidia tusciae DSM 2912]